MLKKFLVVALLACFALNGIVQAEESATEKEKIQILDLYHINPDKTNISMQHYKNEEYGFSFAVPEKDYKEYQSKNKNILYSFRGDGRVFLVDCRPFILKAEDLKTLNTKFFYKKLADLEEKGYKILLKEQLSIAKYPAMRFSYYLPEKELAIFDDYIIITPNGIYKFSYVGNRFIYPIDEKLFLPKIIQSVKITPLSDDIYRRPFTTKTLKDYPASFTTPANDDIYRRPFTTKTLKDYPASFTTPANCVLMPIKNDPHHTFAYSNGYFFVSPMIVNITDKAELSFYPNSFANLSDKDKETLAAKEAARIQMKVEARQKENPKYKLDNIKAQFITIGGENCLNVSFDLSSSTEMDYIFVRDGKFISFDYQYPFDDAKRQKAAVVKSAKSIRFNP